MGGHVDPPPHTHKQNNGTRWSPSVPVKFAMSKKPFNNYEYSARAPGPPPPTR